MARTNSTRPLYKRVAVELRAAVESGKFADDVPLPTEAELCERYGVSRHTIRQAFQDLVSEGLVYRIPGRGTFVTGLSKRGHYLRSVGTIEDLMAWSGTAMRTVRPLEMIDDEQIAAQLGCPEEKVARLVVSRSYEGVPFVVTYVYLPPKIVKNLAAKPLPNKDSKTVIGTLDQLLEAPVVGADQYINVKPLPEEAANHIDCEAGTPVLYVERRYFDSRGANVELACSYYDPKRYSYRIQLRRKVS